MRILMLGWEFPPFITGGLGTACYGLTKALARQQAQVVFVLPKPVVAAYASHVRLLSPAYPPCPSSVHAIPSVPPRLPGCSSDAVQPASLTSLVTGRGGDWRDSLASSPMDLPTSIELRSAPVKLASVYQSAGGRFQPLHSKIAAGSTPAPSGLSSEQEPPSLPPVSHLGRSSSAGSNQPPAERGEEEGGGGYGGDMMQQTQAYADFCIKLAEKEQFDVIHAHDWMTYPAGLAVAAATGKPLVVHVHSTEFDRSGQWINQRVYDIERRGMHGAMRVVAVSYLTQSIINRRYGIDPDKIDVVYNGIDYEGHHEIASPTASGIGSKDKIVLFLGRVTMQKGPEYFVHAAKRVLEKMDNVKFVMAGSGDMIHQVIELAAEQGIGHKLLFTGFLHTSDVQKVFEMADVYVMPSVSEPFGIACLEAISHDVPVIISKTSGVSEVLANALKVDFWDTDEMANKIIAVLRHPPLSSTLRQHADIEVRRLTWDDAATRCLLSYRRAMEMVPSDF